MNDKLELIGGRKMVVGNSLRAMAKAGTTRPSLLLDRSGSMASYVNPEHERWGGEQVEGAERKIDALRRIVGNLRKEADFDQLVFESHCEWTEEIGEPAGGTNLTEALEQVTFGRPTTRRIVLITDGYPDNRISALEAAKRLPCPLDIFYVGPANDLNAQEYLKELAAAAGGQFGQADLKESAQLESKVKLALKAGDADEIKRGPIVL